METKEIYRLRPSIGGSFSFGWQKMFATFIYLLVAVIITGIVDGPVSATYKADQFHLWMIPAITFGMIWGLMVASVVKYGERLVFLQAMRGENIDIKDLFKGFSSQYLNIILANLIVFALIAVGIIMLVIPGIIIACRLAFVPYIIMDQKLEPMQAVEKSWQMTRGHGWEIFFMAILSFFIIIGGIICCIVGVFISLIWIHSAFASLYQAVLNDEIKNNTIPIIEVREG